jgi:ADP-ribose pyrophosphatase YjhB (NUDIX family)
MLADEVNFCPRCGSGLIQMQRLGRLRPSCPKCEWIFFPDPKVAVAVQIVEEGKILLVRRSNNPQQGLWTLPAGFVDAGEDPKLAAERECLEETGLVVKVTDLIDVLSGQEHERGADILIVYQAVIYSGALTPGDDADQAAFFLLEQLPPLAFNSTNKILKSLLQEHTQRSS